LVVVVTKAQYLAAKFRYNRAGEAYRKKHSKETASKYAVAYNEYINAVAAYAERR
jgi:hypothetical protein